jgi:hypothetical protein
MKIDEDFYRAEGAEGQRLKMAASRIYKVADELDLTVADMMNVMINLIADIAFTECIDRQTLLEIIGKVYDMHVESATKDETIN